MRSAHPGRGGPDNRYQTARPAVPVARPYAPPPSAAGKGSSLGRQIKLIALVIVVVGSVALGAIYLPGISLKSEPKHVATVQDPVPDEDGTDEEVRYTPSRELEVPSDNPPPVPLTRTTETTQINTNSERRLMDVVQTAPQLPEASGAFEVAGTIDREINQVLAKANVPASSLASDAEFIRRLYLDLTGRIPPRERVVAFLDSADPYKRAKLIDELLASPEYGKHFAQLWTDLLVKRDFENNKNLKTDTFSTWLADHLNKNTPWNKLVGELLTIEGKEDQTPQVFFYLANQDNNQPAPEKLVGAVGNLFMGIQVQCAQCHRHPYVGKWGQQDFWGMAAFFGRTRFERDSTNKKQTGPATVKEVDSVPNSGKKGGGRPILAGAVINIPDPNDTKKVTGQATAKFFESDKPPLGNKGPYRPALATWVSSAQNKYFAPAAVNRMWHHFFARGFVNPIEEMGGDQEPSHPELLKVLADEFTRSNYDLKFLIRAIANSQTYQRTSRPLPANVNDEKLFSHMAVKVLGARQLLDSLSLATGQQIRTGGDPSANKAAKGNPGGGGLLRFFDTAEYDEDPTEFTYGIPQLLRLMNSNLSGSSTGAADRLVKGSGGNQPKAIEDMFLTILSRRPLPSEVQKLQGFISKQGSKGYSGAFWALLNSAEFMSNH